MSFHLGEAGFCSSRLGTSTLFYSFVIEETGLLFRVQLSASAYAAVRAFLAIS